MDMNTLIDQILARVTEVVTAAETCACTEKPRLLVLTQEHGTCCHEMLESPRLKERYDTDCALLLEYQCDAADYDVVILYGLTVEAMSKLATGVCDTPYTALAARALLLGKRVLVPSEEVELYRYAATAPAAYYAMMEEKLRLLLDSSVVICAQANLESAVLSGAPDPCAPPPCGPCSPLAPAPAVLTKEVRLEKRVITERDITSVKEQGATRLLIGEKTILTDLARDLAKGHHIQVVRA